MSNHYVGYVLSEVLIKLNSEGFFKDKSKEEVAEFMIEVAKIARNYDGNMGEALEDIGYKFNVCENCYQYSEEDLDDDNFCANCR